MLEHVEDAVDILDESPTAISSAVEKLREGIALLVHRNKFIVIADSSEAGWATVSEYEQNPLADDSDDDKKIRKAESAAVAKLAKKRQENSRRSRTRNQVPYTSGVAYSAQPSLPTFTPGFLRSLRLNGGYAVQNNGRRSNVPSDTCIQCGQKGHWKRFCPVLGAISATAGHASAGTQQ